MLTQISHLHFSGSILIFRSSQITTFFEMYMYTYSWCYSSIRTCFLLNVAFINDLFTSGVTLYLYRKIDIRRRWVKEWLSGLICWFVSFLMSRTLGSSGVGSNPLATFLFSLIKFPHDTKQVILSKILILFCKRKGRRYLRLCV